MNVPTKASSLAVITAVALMGCGKEAPPPVAVPAPPPPMAAKIDSVAPLTGGIAPKDLAAKSGCLACHAVDKKLIGPSYQDVARKYTATDEAMLVAKVKAGGKGVWGPIPMPPNANVSEDDVKTLVKWILDGAK